MRRFSTIADIETIVTQIRENDPSLTSDLDVSRTNMGDSEAQILAEALASNRTITSLNVGYNDIGPVGLGAIFESLKTNVHLKSLSFEGQKAKLDGPTGKALGQLVSANQNLKHLILRHCNLTHEFVSEFAVGLSSNKGLAEIDIAQSGLNDSSANALCDAVAKTASVTIVSLARNDQMTSSSGKTIHDLLKDKNIVNLDVSGCNLGDQGISTLASALSGNPSLKELDLSYNNFGEQGASALQQALGSNSVLSYLGQAGNNYSEQTADALTKSLAGGSASSSHGKQKLSNEILQETFQIYANDEYEMSAEDLGTAIRALGWNPSEADVAGYMVEADRDASGTISFDEFQALVYGTLESVPMITIDDLKNAFSIFDLHEEDNAITTDEMTHLLKKMGDNLTDEECAKLIAKVDSNKDGEVDIDEFVELLKPLDLRPENF